MAIIARGRGMPWTQGSEGIHSGNDIEELTRSNSSVGAGSFRRMFMMSMITELGSLLEMALVIALTRLESSRSFVVADISVVALIGWGCFGSVGSVATIGMGEGSARFCEVLGTTAIAEL